MAAHESVDEPAGEASGPRNMGNKWTWAQVIGWAHQVGSTDPFSTIDADCRGTVILPEVESSYRWGKRLAKHADAQRRQFLERIKTRREGPWPESELLTYDAAPEVFGSPLLDEAVARAGSGGPGFKGPLDGMLKRLLRTCPKPS